MNRITLSILATIICFVAVAQENKEKYDIQVVGNSMIMVKPDIGVLIVEMTSKSLTFNQTILGINDKTKTIVNRIKSIGFKDEEIKTSDFEINRNRIYTQDKEYDSGYICTQTVRIDFKNEQITISKILDAFSKEQDGQTLRFDFKLSEQLLAKVKDDLLKQAIENSMTRAKLISETAKIRLKRIKEIKYGLEHFNPIRDLRDFIPPPLALEMNLSSIAGFTPSDLQYYDSVLIIWETD